MLCDSFPVSSVTGEGVEALRGYLLAEAQEVENARTKGAFRMSVDRSFIIEGAGVVATGLVLSGSVNVNDRVMIAPAGVEVRVRTIHAQNRKSDAGRAGERCALNITAPRLTLGHVGRGDWLLDASLHAPVRRFDARIRLLRSEERPLRHWTPVHLHIGAADLTARVAVLQSGDAAGEIEPGADGFVQIVAQEDLSVLHGDHFVLRDQSAVRTIAGGVVIDPFAPDRGRARAERLALVSALERGHLVAALAAALAAAPAGLPFGSFCQARNIAPEECMAALESLQAVVKGEGSQATAFTQKRWDELIVETRILFETAHKQAPGATGQTLPVLQKLLMRKVRSEAVPALLDTMTKAGHLENVSGGWRLAGTGLQLDEKDATAWKRISALLDDQALRPPSVAEIAKALNQPPRTIERTLNRAARVGLACQVAPNRYYLPEHLQRLAEIAAETAAADPGNLLQVRAYRDTSGIGRNLVIEVLEHFDRLGFTHRSGDHRKVLKPVREVKWVRTA